MNLKFLAPVLFAVLLFTSAPGCAHPPPTLTTPAQAAYTAAQVVQRIGEFQQAVIDASDAGRLPVAIAREIVQQTTATLQALAGPPTNWKDIVRQFWGAERPHLLAQPPLASWVAMLDLIVGGL